jgi:hypothetical protein
MYYRFDQIAKQIAREALAPSGITVVHDEVTPEIQHADLRHEPDPTRGAERERLGLLGRIAAVLCLVEVYGHAPGADEFRACLAKQIAFWRRRARKARSDNDKRRASGVAPEAFVEPFLWIITAGAPTSIVTKLELKAAPDWPRGVYFFGGDILRVGLVVASELPRDRATLLVRLMAAGPLLDRAIEDLIALPPDAHERAVAEQILLSLQHALGQKADRTPEEEEFIVAMHKSWEESRIEAETEGRMKGLAEGLAEGRAKGQVEGLAEGRAKGQVEGRVEGRAEALLTVLRAREISVPDAARERILAEVDPERMKRWIEKAIAARTIGDVLDDPS